MRSLYSQECQAEAGQCLHAAAGRKLMASRMTPYVNITFDFDCFASLSLPSTLSVRPPCHVTLSCWCLLSILLMYGPY